MSECVVERWDIKRSALQSIKKHKEFAHYKEGGAEQFDVSSLYCLLRPGRCTAHRPPHPPSPTLRACGPAASEIKESTSRAYVTTKGHKDIPVSGCLGAMITSRSSAELTHLSTAEDCKRVDPTLPLDS